MDMGERLKELRLKKGVTQEEVGKVINVTKPTIMKYEKGLVENLKRSSIEKLAKYFEVAPSYLMCLDENKIDSFGNPIVSIPILGTVKAGYNYLAQENWIGTIDVDKNIAEGNELFALKVHGDSMSPVLVEDDIVIIKKQNDFENGDIVVAIINGDEATIKKGYKGNTGIELKAINPYYPPRIFNTDEIKNLPVKIIGVVKQLKRSF